MVIMTVKVKTCTAHVFTEDAALCPPLPSTDCDPRGDCECVRSRRQVLKNLLDLLSLSYIISQTSSTLVSFAFHFP